LLGTDVAVAGVQTGQLTLAQRKRLVQAMVTYTTLRDQEKGITEAKGKALSTVAEVLADAGVSSTETDGFRAGVVLPKPRKTLSRLRYAQLGGDLAILDAAYEEEPVKGYIRVSKLGDGE
jgi:hypothetical protein